MTNTEKSAQRTHRSESFCPKNVLFSHTNATLLSSFIPTSFLILMNPAETSHKGCRAHIRPAAQAATFHPPHYSLETFTSSEAFL